MAPSLRAFFLPSTGASGGQRFCVYHPAQTDQPKGSLLYVHSFAEEMNKSRRMVAMQSRALATAGYSVLQIDLLGCGDSSGEFRQATWEAWLSDLKQAALWLQNQCSAPFWWWGLRSGCLLAVAAAQTFDGPQQFVFWHPTPSGKTVLQQFLRLKMAADLQSGQSKQIMETLRGQLTGGDAVEVAGYELSSAVAKGLESATLAPPAKAARLEWLELSTRDDATLMPASSMALTAWTQEGCAVRSHVVHGPAFWQTTEIEDAPNLIAATLAALENPSKANTLSLVDGQNRQVPSDS
jgi:uncharacterized protein